MLRRLPEIAAPCFLSRAGGGGGREHTRMVNATAGSPAQAPPSMPIFDPAAQGGLAAED